MGRHRCEESVNAIARCAKFEEMSDMKRDAWMVLTVYGVTLFVWVIASALEIHFHQVTFGQSVDRILASMWIPSLFVVLMSLISVTSAAMAKRKRSSVRSKP
jgi:hypothetical protein